jgi:quinate dehydrogenase (quinone)
MSNGTLARNKLLIWLVVALLGISGVFLTTGGAYLVFLGGSIYYVIAGIALIMASIFYARSRPAGLYIYFGLFLATIFWSLFEVGLNFWPLVPRLFAATALLFLCLLAVPKLDWADHASRAARFSRYGAFVAAGTVLVTVLLFFKPHGIEAPASLAAVVATPSNGSQDWPVYGKDAGGARFSLANQINPQNVDQLKVAWQYRTGEIAEAGSEFENTPLQVDGRMFICTPHNVVHALDPETGKLLWKFDPQVGNDLAWNRCRGVGYFDGTKPGNAEEKAMPCLRRIILTTLDARMFSLDAETGKRCEDFGSNGEIDLKPGIGEPSILYFLTSAPLIADNLAIIGGLVGDNEMLDEPSGVIRAFDVRTGTLAWAWDLGNPSLTGAPPPGQTYSLATPNSWSTSVYDAELGLVYIPLGNGTPDHWGAHRTAATEAYTDAIVALDARTGRERWKYRTVHHDLWDYDLASPPILHDIPDGEGSAIPAIIQPTKTGQIFVLDRRTGKPIRKVEELPVPKEGGLPGDRLSATQPFSTGMATDVLNHLTEQDMWGMTPLDQLACRIKFRQLRYEGPFTPLSTQGTIVYPSTYGGYNWGGGSVDKVNHHIIINDIQLPMIVKAIPRSEFSRGKLTVGEEDGKDYPQLGTPFGIHTERMKSPLGIPCKAPPYGTLSAIDLKTGKRIWRRPVGTLEDTLLHDVPLLAPIPIGMPTMGGPTSTAGNLVFYAGTVDFFLRAYDARNGQELWKSRLPAGNQGGVITYTSDKSGRQFVALTAGGARESPVRGDYVIAYALPELSGSK